MLGMAGGEDTALPLRLRLPAVLTTSSDLPSLESRGPVGGKKEGDMAGMAGGDEMLLLVRLRLPAPLMASSDTLMLTPLPDWLTM